MLALHLQEHGEGRLHAHLLGVAGVDAGDDRLGDTRQRLAAEAAADEVGEALVGCDRRGTRPVADRDAATRQHQVEPHAQLARPAHEAAEREGDDARRHHEDDALGQLVQAAAREDEALADVLVRVEQAVADVEPARHLDRPGLLDDRRVRAALDDEPVAAHGVDLAAEARLLLEEDPVDVAAGEPGVLEGTGGAEPRHAAADHGDPRGARGVGHQLTRAGAARRVGEAAAPPAASPGSR